MRAPIGAGIWLALALCAVAALSGGLALVVQERGLRRDLERVTREHVDRARAVTARMLRVELEAALARYRASAATPELRANLEVSHAPTLHYFAAQLAREHGARALAFARGRETLALEGSAALARAALARRSALAVDPAACAAADAWVCADRPGGGAAFSLAHRGRLYVVAIVPLRAGTRALGQLIAVDEIGAARLAEWGALVRARIALEPAADALLSASAADLGTAKLHVEVDGRSQRLAFENARRDLLASGAVALLLAWAVSLGLSHLLLRPIRRIGEISRRLRAGDLSPRLRSRRGGELGEVERAFDAMLDRVETALQTLRRSEARLAHAQARAALGSFSIDLGSGCIEVSTELRRICGLGEAEALDVGALLERCVHPADRARVRASLERCIGEGVPLRMDHRTPALDGGERLVHTQAERIARAGAPLVVEGTLQDLTERRLVEEQVRYLADHDDLTGLWNRRLFVRQLEIALGEARLARRSFAVFLLGLDDFQRLNATLGPSSCDRALEEVAARLARVAAVEGSAVAPVALARLGGDEFALLVPGAARPADAARVARRVLRAFEPPFALDGGPVAISASLGIAAFPGDGDAAESLLRNAGAALRSAKQEARGSHRFYDASMNALALRRLALENALRRALEVGDLQLHYQPKLELASGRVGGAEALMRWCDPELGLVSPAEFIPLAEETGLIHALGAFALRAAAQQIAAWRQTSLEGLRIAVNVSGSQLESAEFPAALERVLAETGIDPASLTLEVTESVMLSEPQGARAALERAAALGVRIALDDFGTGFSSLSYLRELPIHEVKIDRSFVAGIDADERGAALLGAIAALAGVLRLHVIAEGAETAEQLELVRELGCDEVQGYAVSGPVAPAELPAIVAEIERDERKPRGAG